MLKKLLLALSLLALALPAARALAGFDVEVPLETAYNYDGVICTGTGSHAGKTVPRCVTGGVDGSFYFRYFTKGTAVTTATLDSARFIAGAAPGGATKNVCVNVTCVATTPASNPNSLSFSGGNSLVTYNAGTGGANCASGTECATGVGSTGAIYDLQAAGNCAANCHDTELICKVSWFSGGGSGTCANPWTATSLDFSSLKLTIN